LGFHSGSGKAAPVGSFPRPSATHRSKTTCRRGRDKCPAAAARSGGVWLGFWPPAMGLAGIVLETAPPRSRSPWVAGWRPGTDRPRFFAELNLSRCSPAPGNGDVGRTDRQSGGTPRAQSPARTASSTGQTPADELDATAVEAQGPSAREGGVGRASRPPPPSMSLQLRHAVSRRDHSGPSKGTPGSRTSMLNQESRCRLSGP